MITFSDYSFSYDKIEIFRNVDMNFKPGKISVIIGPNGCGKSTLLKCIAGIHYGQGEAKFEDQPLESMNRLERSETISYLSQDVSCNAALTVFEVVLLGRVANLGSTVSEQDLRATHESLKRFNLLSYAQRNISQLSGGQRQMVFVAQALAKSPRVLVFDEPTSALDMCRQYNLMDRIQELTVEHNMTTVLILHHLELVAQYADHVVTIADKSVYREGTPEHVLTEKMFEDVFALDTEVFTDKRGTLRILPIAPIASAKD